MRSTINWKEVRKRGIDMGLDSNAAIARAAGLHVNSIGKYDAYKSTTLDALANLFGCEPSDLLIWEKVKQEV